MANTLLYILSASPMSLNLKAKDLNKMRSQMVNLCFAMKTIRQNYHKNLRSESLNHPALLPLHEHLRVHLLSIPWLSESESVVNSGIDDE